MTSKVDALEVPEMISQTKRKLKDTEEYEVEDIVLHFKDLENNEFRYYVKWKGYSNEQNTWETLDNLNHCTTILLKYLEKTKPSDQVIQTKRSQLECYCKKQLQKINFSNPNLLQDIKDIFKNKFANLMEMSLHHVSAKVSNLNKEINCIIRCILSMKPCDPKITKKVKQVILDEKIYSFRQIFLERMLSALSGVKIFDNVVNNIQNTVDFDVLPEFKYTTENHISEDVAKVYNEEPSVACDCNNCESSENCCNSFFSTRFAYTDEKQLRAFNNDAIYECNKCCSCDQTCPNRVVQLGSQCKICIFKTELYGWGVKTLSHIKKGSFVAEYIGELITETEAHIRDFEYIEKGWSYAFALDNNDLTDSEEEVETFVVDATKFGNFTRFLNHSCDPNLSVYPVYVNCLNPNLPKLAFFAIRSIKKDEELTFDYNCSRNNKNRNKILNNISCLCGSKKCKKNIF